MRRLRVGVVGLALLVGGCAGDEDVTWDLSEPVTGTDLGAVSPNYVDRDGPGPISVRFPSGRTVEFEGFELAEVVLSADGSTDFLDQVRINTSSNPDPEELAELAERFTDEWGPATDADGVTLDEFVAEDSDDDIPRDSRVFVGEEQDGIVPSFDTSVGGGRFATAQFDFEP